MSNPLARIRRAGGQARPFPQVAGFRSQRSTPLPRDPAWDDTPFGPLNPLQPDPIGALRPDSRRPEPRIWQYPQSWNLPGNGTHNHTPWRVLRDAANIPVIRDMIRITKNEIVSLDWDISIRSSAVLAEQGKTGSDEGRADIERKMRERLAPEIDRCKTFWQVPDRGQGYKFAEWIFQSLEEILTIDAWSVYPRYTLGGELYSLEVVDGSTIKPLLDERGGRPMPPFPAYQQILYGFPRGEFTADWMPDEDAPNGVSIPEGYASDSLVYVRREVRTNSPYGCSPVEMCLVDIDLWLKRHAWLRAEYSDGVMPAGWLINDGVTQWTPEQLAEYELSINDLYSGQTDLRQRYRMLPPGIRPDAMPAVDEKYKPEYDLWLLKLLCAHFDMTIAELGFTENRGLGSAGYHEGQADVQNRKNRRPFLKWLGEVLSGISEAHLGMDSSLEFKWLGLEDEDEASADLVDENRVKSARQTINESRDAIGMPRFAFAEADQPMVITQRGVVFIEGAAETALAGELVQPADAPTPAVNSDGTLKPAPAGASGGGAPGKSGGAKPSGAGKAEGTSGLSSEQLAELAQYVTYSTKRDNRRPFVFHYLNEGDREGLGL